MSTKSSSNSIRISLAAGLLIGLAIGVILRMETERLQEPARTRRLNKAMRAVKQGYEAADE